MTTPNPVVSKYPVVSYFTVAFAVSWGALLAVVGPGGFIGTTEPTSAQFPFVGLAMFAGPRSSRRSASPAAPSRVSSNRSTQYESSDEGSPRHAR
jgi:hypothetical protein